MRLRARVDKNHVEIVGHFIKKGFSVLSLAQLGKGVPDLLVSNEHGCWLVEVKDGDKAKFTPDQKRWMRKWKGVSPVRIGDIRDVDIWTANLTLERYGRSNI